MRWSVWLVVVGLVGSDVGCIFSGCFELRGARYDIPLPVDAAMQFRLDRRALDVETCVDVCALAMERDGKFEEIKACGVSVGDTKIRLEVLYKQFSGGNACFQEGDDVPLPPSDF